LGIASIGLTRVLVPDAGPSSVTFVPAELAPFAVRCEFRFVEDDAGTAREALVGAPALAETATAIRQHAEISPLLQRTLAENVYRYRRIAELILQGRMAAAVEPRKAMLESWRRKDGSKRQWTPLERLDLLLEYEGRAGEIGLMVNLGNERGGIQRFEISRQLKSARAERASATH
jgi:hypothetical protein